MEFYVSQISYDNLNEKKYVAYFFQYTTFDNKSNFHYYNSDLLIDTSSINR